MIKLPVFIATGDSWDSASPTDATPQCLMFFSTKSDAINSLPRNSTQLTNILTFDSPKTLAGFLRDQPPSVTGCTVDHVIGTVPKIIPIGDLIDFLLMDE